METILPQDDLELHRAFEIILSIESLNDYIVDIAELIYKNELSRENLQKVLIEYNISKVESIKDELLDLLIIYINLVLNDHIICEDEKRNVEFLKKYFKIKEGDFYQKKFDELEDILHRQFERLYSDNLISKDEAIHNVNLQDLFDLSYDQLDTFKEIEVKKVLEQGANIADLDTAKFPNVFTVSNQDASRSISQKVKGLVWNRDNGKCRECGSNEKLEFDHIIPFSKGGSNTYRNIQLLCERCNRKKYSKIG